MKKSLDDLEIYPVAMRTASVPAWSTEIVIKLKVMVFKDDECFECYLKDEDHAYQHMFGLPKKGTTMSQAMEIAVANAPQYLDLFQDEEA